MVGVAVLILFGLLVAAAATAVVSAPTTPGALPIPWPTVQVPFQHTLALDAIRLTGGGT